MSRCSSLGEVAVLIPVRRRGAEGTVWIEKLSHDGLVRGGEGGVDGVVVTAVDKGGRSEAGRRALGPTAQVHCEK